jgi:dihydrofolate reductase
MSRVSMIAAVARERVIGGDNQLLWHLPEDMAFFKRQTLGHPVLMGRRTWNSIPPRFRPLTGRRNIVITRDASWDYAGAERTGTLDEALARVADAPKVFIIGGGALYASALHLADELVITEIDKAFVGDTYFPPFGDEFAEVSREAHRAAAPNDFGYAFVTYQRKR